jgi:hypothetical protein
VPGKKITCTETILQQTRIVKVGNRTCVIFTKLLHIYDPQENENVFELKFNIPVCVSISYL